MARVAATKIDVQDLEYVIEYLLVFTVSRRAYNSDTTITKGKNRVKLLQAALTLEKAMLELRDQEYLDAVDRVCVDIEGIMVAALCPADIQKVPYGFYSPAAAELDLPVIAVLVTLVMQHLASLKY